MMVKPIALQLYSVRDAAAQDFEGTVRKVAAMGYAGVEPAGFPGTTAQAASALFKSLGLDVPSAHVPLPLGDRKNEVLDTIATLGAKYVVCPYIPPEEYSSLDNIRSVIERLNAADEVVRSAGYTFCYHNHWWEYQPVEGRLPYQVMLEGLHPSVRFELDTYWIQTAGLDPAAVEKEVGDRLPLIHIKDGPTDKDRAMTPLGTGKIDIPAVVAAGEAAEWLIVELDRCDTDMMQAVGQSLQYMLSKGLGRGKAN
jgi:sugar phosphate isomerase/epimerase